MQPTCGHKIESINNVYSNDPFDWVLFDYTTKMPSKEGKLDLFLCIAIGSHGIYTLSPLVEYVTWYLYSFSTG